MAANRKRRTTGIKNRVSSSSVSVQRGREQGPRVGRDGRAKVGCPGCGTEYMVPEASLDKQLRCKSCGTAFVPNQATRQAAPEQFNAQPYYIGAGVLVLIIGIYLGTRSGPAQVVAEVIQEEPKVTGMNNVRVRNGKEWATGMATDNVFMVQKNTDFTVAGAKFPAETEEATVAAMLADESAHWFDEFEVTSAALDSADNHDGSSGHVVVYLSAKDEWSSKKGGKPYWYPKQSLELQLDYRLYGETPKFGNWTAINPPKPQKRRKPAQKAHDNIGKAEVVERNIGGQIVKVIEAEPAALPHLDDTPAELRAEIDKLVPQLRDDDPRLVNRAMDRLTLISKPAVPILLTQLFETKADAPDAIFHLRRTCQALEQITGQRFGFTSAASIGGQSTSVVRESALKQWFGYWTTHHDRKDWDIARDEEESLEIDESDDKN